ncbi:hypothetical protein BJY24_003685 [Nocardia transvalensis]|uniref:Uncharacterized protein n=1 Tax=Nocardia transvalensis TaxID=37333 RepID=A0A7W9PFR7_9NOCA|nr:hypothetical protein [Nocardia transvalensis]MBB5914818.1 hypothetical protein [Nocardia transvalensis]
MAATTARRSGIATQVLIATVATMATVFFSCLLLQHHHPHGNVSRPTGQQPPGVTAPR